jgi:hypothetical protein
LAKGAGKPRVFFHAYPALVLAPAHRLIVAILHIMLETDMVPDQTLTATGFISRIIIDDRSRLPGRFFGRFTTSATSELTRA